MTEKKGLAIASLVLGIVGLFFFGLILGPLAIVFGIISLNKVKKQPKVYAGKGMAIAGIVIGAIALVWSIVWLGVISASILAYIRSALSSLPQA